MRVWLLLGKQGEDPGGLESLLRQWAARPENGHWQVGTCLAGAELSPGPDVLPAEVLVAAENVWPGGTWGDSLLEQGKALVLALPPTAASRFQALAETHPVLLIPSTPTVDCLGLAVIAARAAWCRQQHWKAQVQTLQQRLNDRIVIERAKGILVQRLGVSEEEAYKRLRVLSRRQRRQIRDIAQSLLDTQSLLMPDANGFTESLPNDE
jgi:hypothetical protein